MGLREDLDLGEDLASWEDLDLRDLALGQDLVSGSVRPSRPLKRGAYVVTIGRSNLVKRIMRKCMKNSVGLSSVLVSRVYIYIYIHSSTFHDDPRSAPKLDAQNIHAASTYARTSMRPLSSSPPRPGLENPEKVSASRLQLVPTFISLPYRLM